MKYYYALTFLLFFGLCATAQIINFPDAHFKAILLAADVSNNTALDSNDNSIKIDADNNGEIEVSEALTVKTLTVYHYPYDPLFSISSLEGIQNFTNLTKLVCPANDLTSLPIMDTLVNLTYFDCSGNHLPDIHGVENVTSLEILLVSSNPITSVNLSNLTNLWAFNCNETLLTCIDASSTSVVSMWCYNNPNLAYVNIRNNHNTVSVRLAAHRMPTIPPPLPYLNFTDDTNLVQICHDDGEYGAVLQGFFGESTAGINITTTCTSFDCDALSNVTATASLFSAFPNPVSDQLNISLSDNDGLKSVVVYDVLGQKLIDTKELVVNTNSLAKGTYFVTVETNVGKETRKIIKQ